MKSADTSTDFKLSAFTSQHLSWVSSWDVPRNGVLIARYKAQPNSEAIIFLRNPASRNRVRVKHSVAYIHEIISQYVLHQNFFDFYAEQLPPGDREFYVVAQIADETSDIPMTVGYSGSAERMMLIPDVDFWFHKGYYLQRQTFRRHWLEWDAREPIVFWRGSTTGARVLTLESLADLPRYRLCALAGSCSRLRNRVDAKFTNVVQIPDAQKAEEARNLLQNMGMLTSSIKQADFLRYRFQIDIDGNSSAWSLLVKLLMGSCVLKVTSTNQQWYYKDLRAWEHYVPVATDLSDFEEKVTWCLDNDTEAREIARKGARYAKRLVYGTEMPLAAQRLIEATRVP